MNRGRKKGRMEGRKEVSSNKLLLKASPRHPIGLSLFFKAVAFKFQIKFLPYNRCTTFNQFSPRMTLTKNSGMYWRSLKPASKPCNGTQMPLTHPLMCLAKPHPQEAAPRQTTLQNLPRDLLLPKATWSVGQ